MMMWGPVLFAILGGFLVVMISLYFCATSLARLVRDIWDEMKQTVKDVVEIWSTKE